MIIIPNFIQNTSEIVEVLNTQLHEKFNPRTGADTHESIIPGLRSRFTTLKDIDMPDWFIDMLFNKSGFTADLRDFYNFIQIQRYDIGDFIVPHKDVYSITKLHLVTLTSSDSDGLIIEDGCGGLTKIVDCAGNYIDGIDDKFHWVDPVKSLRYTLVVTE